MTEIKIPKPPFNAAMWIGLAAGVLWVIYAARTTWWPAPAGPVAPPIAVAPEVRQPVQPSQLSGPDAPVIFRVTLDNSYPEPAPQAQPPVTVGSASQQQILEAALRVLPPRAVPLPAPVALPAFINQQFLLTTDAHPSAVNAIAEAIRFWNGDFIAGDVMSAGPQGTVRIPLVAPLATPGNTLTASATVTAGRTIETSEVLSLPTGVPLTPDSGVRPRFSNYFVRDQVRSLSDNRDVQALVASPLAEILAKPIEIELARQQPQAASAEFAPPDDDRWRQAVKSGGRDVRLYVLDTGWPDAAAMRESVAEIQAMSEAVRKWYFFPEASVPAPTQFVAPKDPHVEKVQEALRPLLTVSDRVKVIYVPMTRDQGARALLKEMVWVGFAIARLPDWGEKRPSAKSVGQRAFAAVSEKDVDAAVMTMSPDSAGARFNTSLGLLWGLFLMAQARGGEAVAPYFVSQSWTTSDQDVIRKTPMIPNGLVVAAVGNAAPRDVMDPRLAFAGWSMLRNEVLAVMTLDAAGNPSCRTSTVTMSDSVAGVVGYDGRIWQPQECGSSYATPRVAWYLAAADSLRAAPASYDVWIVELRDRIAGLRPRGAPLPQSLLFDPVEYFKRP